VAHRAWGWCLSNDQTGETNSPAKCASEVLEHKLCVPLLYLPAAQEAVCVCADELTCKVVPPGFGTQAVCARSRKARAGKHEKLRW